jgi:hypothetical protein
MGLHAAKVSVQEAQEGSEVKGVDAAPAAGKKRGEPFLPSLTPQVVQQNISLHFHALFFHLLHTVENSFYLIKGRITSTKSAAETIDNTAVMSLSFLRSDIPINLLSHSNTFF